MCKKEIFSINETEETLASVISKVDFSAGLFIKDFLFAWGTDDGFHVGDNCYFNLYLSYYSELQERVLNLFTADEIEEYEEYSEKLNSWNDYLQEYISAKLEIDKEKVVVQDRTKIHSYNTVPFYIQSEYFVYDDDWNDGDLVLISFEVNSNMK